MQHVQMDIMCDKSEGCNFINVKSKLCQINRDKDSPMCGRCKTRYSETTPDVGYCL